MSIFRKYTVRNLKRNKTRTVVTIIGIILSVAMFTAVTESIVSGQNYLLNTVKCSVGSFHAAYYGIDSETLSRLEKDTDYERAEFLQDLGYAKITSKNSHMPYIHLDGMSKGFTDLAAVRLTQGRMPVKSNEIVLSEHILTVGKLKYNLGDKLTLSVGQRADSDGNILIQNIPFNDGETLINTEKKEYTVVGFCARPDTKIEIYEAPGFTAYTLPENNGNGTYTVFFTLKDPKILDQTAETGYGQIFNVNTDYLLFSGSLRGGGFTTMVYELGFILILIIIIGSVALIYTSFSISVSERTKQYGILCSVGATKKQLMGSVLFEAFLLCLCAIPLGLLSGCLGIGVTFNCLSNEFNQITSTLRSGEEVAMKLVPSFPALFAASLISIFTSLVSAYIPAKRALRLSPLDAIKMTGDVKNKKTRHTRSSKLSYKLFGFEGMISGKNFKRNRKKYRTTVLSLATSLVLFISASSFCMFFTDSFKMEASSALNADVIAISETTESMTGQQLNELSLKLSSVEGIKEYANKYVRDNNTLGFTEMSLLTDKFKSLYGITGNEEEAGVFTATDGKRIAPAAPEIVFINNEAFDKLLRNNGLDPENYYDKASPMCVIYDNDTFVSFDDNKKHNVTENCKMLSTDKFPFDLSITFIKNQIDGFFFNRADENEKLSYKNYDTNEEKLYDKKDCLTQCSYNIGGEIRENAFWFSSSATMLIYPEKMMPYVKTGNADDSTLCFNGLYKAADHDKVYKKMLEIANEYDIAEIHDNVSGNEAGFAIMTLIKVFSYGFIVLISLIAAANAFNTVSTNILLRRRELSMLRSVGLSGKGLNRMMSYESLLYGAKSLILGLPLSAVLSFLIYLTVRDSGYTMPFTLPWTNVLIAILSVFIVVFSGMIYSVSKIKKCNTADELKNENI